MVIMIDIQTSYGACIDDVEHIVCRISGARGTDTGNSGEEANAKLEIR